MLGQHRRVKHRVLFVGERVVMRSHLVKLTIYIVGTPLWCSFEDHVLQKMTHARNVSRLISRTGIDEKPHGRRIRRRIALGDNLQSVFQSSCLEFDHGLTPLRPESCALLLTPPAPAAAPAPASPP